MSRGTEPFLRPPRRQEVANMANVLAQVELSGRIYFVTTLSKTAIQTRETATLSLPTQFAEENGNKIEEWVILRAYSSARPWAVRLSVGEAGKVRICDGLYAFVSDNELREGDSLIFVLQEDARSEFEVYIFRGSRGDPLFPDRRDRSPRDEENNSNRSSFPCPLHHQDEHKEAFTSGIGEGKSSPSRNSNPMENHRAHKKAFTNDVNEGKTTPLQIAYHRQNHIGFPSFRKQLSAFNIGRSDRSCGSNSGRFEFPRRFIMTYGRQVEASVKLQGIHEDSPTHLLTCRQRPGNSFRVDFLVTEWSRFVKENGLQKGHELQFSLIADSYFVVRKVHSVTL